MSKTKNRSVWTWVGAIIAGCGLCCLPFLIPLLGGAVVAGGVSMAFWDAGWWELVICVLALAVLAVGVYWLIRRRTRRSAAEACTPNIDPNSTEKRVNVSPLE